MPTAWSWPVPSSRLVFLLIGACAVSAPADQIPTTVNDFFLPGTQPETLEDAMIGALEECIFCHGSFDMDQAPAEQWLSSMKANSMRDPLFHGALAIANQDAADSGESCIRCHAPKGWLAGRSLPPDGSGLDGTDWEGVTCIACHRMVDLEFDADNNPAVDEDILNALALLPDAPGNAMYVIDPLDRRRGPFQLNEPFFWHDWLQSPFHQEAAQCGTCHDVSNPVYVRVGGPVPSVDDTYVLAADDLPHPTFNKYDMFPEQRTYSEWLLSDFGQGPIEMGGRFGGNKSAVSTCQDCHMPDISGVACDPGLDPVFRDDLPKHSFLGTANWVLDAIFNLDPTGLIYPTFVSSNMTPEHLADAKARNAEFLQQASDLELSATEGILTTRVINETGHKLPTGYPEGRRIWINVQLYDAFDQLIEEFGAYDELTAELATEDTKVYEIKYGVDEAVSQQTGIPAGTSFHLVVNNVLEFDNRIPPRGFTYDAFEAVQAMPVGYEYADGQHFDDTEYLIPCDAASATVRVYFQTSSKEYIEFLEAENVTNDRGEILMTQYLITGMSAPILMDEETIDFDDCNGNLQLDACDISMAISPDANGNGVPDECDNCPAATIVFADPAPGTIDARQPNDVSTFLPRQGIGSADEPIVITLSGAVAGADASCFVLCESQEDPILGANAIAGVADLGGGTYELVLDHPIAPGAATTIAYEGSSVTYYFHPANTNGDSAAGVADVLFVVNMLNGQSVPPWGLYSQDMDRSGFFNAADVLRAIDLLNGANTFDVWNLSALPEPEICP